MARRYLSGEALTVQAKSGTYTATAQDEAIIADATSAGFTITLPTITAALVGQPIYIKKVDSSANAVTVSRGGTDTIDGATSISLAIQYDWCVLVAGATGKWSIFSGMVSATPSTSAVGDTAAAGTGLMPARSDHKHAREAFATNTIALSTAAAAGSATTLIRSDATIAAFDATVPVTQAIGDAAATGSINFAARRDHKHGMPAFATNAIVLGTAAAAGSATTLMRTDDTIAAFDATVPTTSAVGDAAAVGSVAKAARRDHTHGREGFGNVTAVTRGDASTNGSAVTLARSDHNHGFPFNPDFKQPCRVATTANIATLAGGAPNTLDGVSLAANDRILVKDQSTGSQNGIYFVQTLGTGANGTWTRATDADNVSADTELRTGATVAVSEGTASADSVWMLTTNGSITIGTTSLTFSKIIPASASFGTPAITWGTSSSPGVATTAIRTDATIALFDITAASTSAVGDAATTGVAAFAAHRDHVHGRESFGSTVTVKIGDAATSGSATTPARSDHNHGYNLLELVALGAF